MSERENIYSTDLFPTLQLYYESKYNALRMDFLEMRRDIKKLIGK